MSISKAICKRCRGLLRKTPEKEPIGAATTPVTPKIDVTISAPDESTDLEVSFDVEPSTSYLVCISIVIIIIVIIIIIILLLLLLSSLSLVVVVVVVLILVLLLYKPYETGPL